MEVLRDWLKNGLLEKVNQIGAEFHYVSKHLETYRKLIWDLDLAGFRIIAMDPNLTFDPGNRPRGSRNIFGDFFEIVFRKVKSEQFLKC